MPKFYSIEVDKIIRETDDCVSIGLKVPGEWSEQFRFLPGQYLTFRIYRDGEEIRRSYSISTAPHENRLRVAVKKVPGGRFSTYANEELRAGDSIDVMPPQGRFTLETDADNEHNYLAFAAGSGITPVIGIIKAALHDEPNSTFTLFYGNRYTQSIIFKEELEGLKNRYLERFRLFHILSKERTDAAVFHGRIDPEKCNIIFRQILRDESFNRVFLCGPQPMTFALKACLPDLGVDKKKIKFELFTSPDQLKTRKEEVEEESEEQMCKVDLKLDGNRYELEVSPRDNILDAATDLGIDLPYSCKGGVCSTCRAKLLEGEVEMEVNYALEPDELEAGFILTCQSHPRSEHLVIDYDQ